jgi:hypothetical protein
MIFVFVLVFAVSIPELGCGPVKNISVISSSVFGFKGGAGVDTGAGIIPMPVWGAEGMDADAGACVFAFVFDAVPAAC